MIGKKQKRMQTSSRHRRLLSNQSRLRLPPPPLHALAGIEYVPQRRLGIIFCHHIFFEVIKSIQTFGNISFLQPLVQLDQAV